MTLFDLYNTDTKSYYDIQYIADKLFPGTSAEDEARECERFLYEHYMEGKKLELLRGDLYKQYEKKGKHVHSASLYLLGKALMPCFQEKLNAALSAFLPNYEAWNDGSRDLLYTWYLPSMFHDYASCIELDMIQPGEVEQSNYANHRNLLDSHLKNQGIQYSLYGDYPYHVSSVPVRFSQELVADYFYYRACEGSCEHGILAGYLFFDHFVKLFREKTKNAIFEKDGNCRAFGLTWNKELVSYAAYAADAIICHNIWMAGPGAKEKYEKYGLGQLLWNDHPENKLNIHKYPLQFMLCLLDTIEPTKRFPSMFAYEILHKISILEDAEKSGFTIAWKDLSTESNEFKDWHKNIMGLKDWMDIECKADDSNSMIQIKWY